jgi:hypothetical protein
LVRKEQLGRTPLAWLGERAAANTSKAIVAELKKLDFLRELGVTEWGLSTINPQPAQVFGTDRQKSHQPSAAAFGACTALSDRSRLSAPLHGGDYRRTCGHFRSLSCPILFPRAAGIQSGAIKVLK